MICAISRIYDIISTDENGKDIRAATLRADGWQDWLCGKGSEVGIDIVAKSNFCEYVAIQAK